MNTITVSPKSLKSLKSLKPLQAPTATGTATKKAQKVEKAIVGHADADVVKKLADAVTAADTLVGACREAAKLAAKQFNPAAKPADNVKTIVALYTKAGAFHDATGKDNANVKSVFSDALLLLAANDVPVTVVKSGKEIHTTAGKAVDMPKHDLRAAASQIRAVVSDKSRAKGAGRKPGGKVASPTQPTAASKVASKKAGPVMTTPAEEVWLVNLAAFLGDPDMIAKIKVVCSENGFTLSKKPAKK